MWEQNLKMEDCWQRPLGPTIVPDLVATTFQFNLSWWKANQRFFSGQLPIQLDKDRKNILGRKGAKTSTFSNTRIAHTRLAQDLLTIILLEASKILTNRNKSLFPVYSTKHQYGDLERTQVWQKGDRQSMEINMTQKREKTAVYNDKNENKFWGFTLVFCARNIFIIEMALLGRSRKNLIQNTLKSSCSLFHFQAISNIAILVPLLFLKILALRYITYMRMCVLYLWWSLRHSLPSASDNFRKIGSHPPPACLSSPLTLKRTQKQKVLWKYIFLRCLWQT